MQICNNKICITKAYALAQHCCMQSYEGDRKALLTSKWAQQLGTTPSPSWPCPSPQTCGRSNQAVIDANLIMQFGCVHSIQKSSLVIPRFKHSRQLCVRIVSSTPLTTSNIAHITARWMSVFEVKNSMPPFGKIQVWNMQVPLYQCAVCH